MYGSIRDESVRPSAEASTGRGKLTWSRLSPTTPTASRVQSARQGVDFTPRKDRRFDKFKALGGVDGQPKVINTGVAEGTEQCKAGLPWRAQASAAIGPCRFPHPPPQGRSLALPSVVSGERRVAALRANVGVLKQRPYRGQTLRKCTIRRDSGAPRGVKST